MDPKIEEIINGYIEKIKSHKIKSKYWLDYDPADEMDAIYINALELITEIIEQEVKENTSEIAEILAEADFSNILFSLADSFRLIPPTLENPPSGHSLLAAIWADVEELIHEYAEHKAKDLLLSAL